LNYLVEHGAITVTDDDRYRPNIDSFNEGIGELLHDVLMLQATGDYNGTKVFIDRFAYSTPKAEQVSDRLADIPVDLAFDFVYAKNLTK
jgi:hypothetical protein